MAGRWWWLIAAVALASCLLPWLVSPAAGLSLNPADLAEWTSLAPAVQAQTPPLLTTFLLRTPLLVVALLIALAANRYRGWAGLFILLLAAAQLPPFEFLNDSANINYRQQLLMAVLTGGLGLLVLFVLPRRFALSAAMVVATLGLIAAVLGIASALREMQAFALPVQIGLGFALYGAALGSGLVLAATAGIKKRRQAAPLPQSS